MIDQVVQVSNPDVSSLVDLLKGFAQFGSQATVSGFIVMGIQWLKKSSLFPWITQRTQRINQLLSVGFAGLTSLGINHIWNPQTRVLAITIPTFAAFLAALSHVSHGVLLNEGIYRAFVKKVTDAETRAMHILESAGKPEVPIPVTEMNNAVPLRPTYKKSSVSVPVPRR